MNYGFIEATSLRQTGKSLPAMQRDGGRRLVRLDVAMWIEVFDADLSAWTRDSAIPDTLVSVAEPAELDDIMAIEGELQTNESKDREWRVGKCGWISDEDNPRRFRSWLYTVHIQSPRDEND